MSYSLRIYENMVIFYNCYSFITDVSYLDALVHFDIDQAKSFHKLSSYGKSRIKDALDKLKQETVLKTWLRTKGLAEDYIDR
jgi:predicted transcriptional regulator